MNKTEKYAYSLIYFFVILGVYFAWTDHEYFQAVYVREDGLIEWLTVIALLCGAGLCFARVQKLKSRKGRTFILATIFLGCLFIFGAGEEISWGQRLLEIKSPDFFKENNSQHETNLHNLVVSGKKVNKIIFGTILGIFIGLYFLVLPYFYHRVEKVKKLINSLAIPLPKNYHVFAYLGLLALAHASGSGKKGELLEFGGCWIFFLMTLYPYNEDEYKL